MEIDAMVNYFSKVSLLGDFSVAAILIVVVIFDIGLTLIHSVQELKGRLWRYFGAIVGVRIPDVLGFMLFFLGLTVFLWIVGFVGITGFLLFFNAPEELAIGSLGLLIGGRFSDRLYSHVRLDRQGFRPNPGLKSTPYYLAEAIILLVLFSPGLLNHYIAAAVGFIIGWMFFYSVLPLLRLVRSIQSLRHEPWQAGEPMPSWAQE